MKILLNSWRRGFVVTALAGLFFYSSLRAQGEEFRTNSGEEFRDPFADAPADNPNTTNPSPSAPVQASPSLSPPATPAQTVNPSSVTPPMPSSAEPPPAVIPNETPRPVLDEGLGVPSDRTKRIEFPEVDEPSGPRTQDLDPLRDLGPGTEVGTWNLGIDLGGAINANRRPSQIHLEVEGGYRLLEKFDLNGILHYRFLKDKVLGFLVMPYYSWRLSDVFKTYRIDLRAGLGTGWLMRSFRGNSFQVGHLPVRASVSGLFYPSSRWAIVLSLDYEIWLLRVDSDGKSYNEFSNKNGLPMHFTPTAGIRFEF